MHVCINTIIHVCVHVREFQIIFYKNKANKNNFKKMHSHSTRVCMLAPVFVARVCLCTCFRKLCVEVAIYIDKNMVGLAVSVTCYHVD